MISAEPTYATARGAASNTSRQCSSASCRSSRSPRDTRSLTRRCSPPPCRCSAFNQQRRKSALTQAHPAQNAIVFILKMTPPSRTRVAARQVHGHFAWPARHVESPSGRVAARSQQQGSGIRPPPDQNEAILHLIASQPAEWLPRDDQVRRAPTAQCAASRNNRVMRRRVSIHIECCIQGAGRSTTCRARRFIAMYDQITESCSFPEHSY